MEIESSILKWKLSSITPTQHKCQLQISLQSKPPTVFHRTYDVTNVEIDFVSDKMEAPKSLQIKQFCWHHTEYVSLMILSHDQ